MRIYLVTWSTPGCQVSWQKITTTHEEGHSDRVSSISYHQSAKTVLHKKLKWWNVKEKGKHHSLLITFPRKDCFILTFCKENCTLGSIYRLELLNLTDQQRIHPFINISFFMMWRKGISRELFLHIHCINLSEVMLSAGLH